MSYCRRMRGIIIPTAILVAMVVLMMVTALMGQTRQNLQFSGLKARESRRLFMARGAVNEFIDRLNGDPTLLGYTEAAPFSGNWRDIDYQVWHEQDPVDPNVHHIKARAFPSGRPGEAIDCESVVQSGPDLSGSVITVVPDMNINSPDPIYVSNSVSPGWSALQALPRSGWKKDGTNAPGSGFAGTLIFGGGDHSGHLYFVYAPGIDGGLDGNWSTMPSVDPRGVGQQALGCLVAAGEGGTQGALTYKPDTLTAITTTAQFAVEDLEGWGMWHNCALWLSRSAAVFEYDTSTSNWLKLPPMLNYELNASNVFVPKHAKWDDGSEAGAYHISGLAGPMACDEKALYVPIYKEGPDLLARYDRAGGTWSAMPPIPDRGLNPTDISYVATTGSDLYVLAWPYKHGGSPPIAFHPKEPPRVLHFNGSGWDPLPEVPSSQVKNGSLVEAPGPAAELGCLAAGSDGSVYVTTTQDQPNTIFKYAGGQWTPLAGPVSSGGTYPEAYHADIGVDGSGSLILRSPNESGADEMYLIHPSDYRQLPPLPAGTSYSSQMIGGAVRNSGQTIYRPKSNY